MEKTTAGEAAIGKTYFTTHESPVEVIVQAKNEDGLVKILLTESDTAVVVKPEYVLTDVKLVQPSGSITDETMKGLRITKKTKPLEKQDLSELPDSGEESKNSTTEEDDVLGDIGSLLDGEEEKKDTVQEKGEMDEAVEGEEEGAGADETAEGENETREESKLEEEAQTTTQESKGEEGDKTKREKGEDQEKEGEKSGVSGEEELRLPLYGAVRIALVDGKFTDKEIVHWLCLLFPDNTSEDVKRRITIARKRLKIAKTITRKSKTNKLKGKGGKKNG